MLQAASPPPRAFPLYSALVRVQFSKTVRAAQSKKWFKVISRIEFNP